MPLFEIVLRDNGTSEVRLTDQPVDVGDTIQVNDEDWVAVRTLPASAQAVARFEFERVAPVTG